MFRYKEFCIPFAAYGAGELSREDFLQLTLELKEIQHEQHDALLNTIEADVFLQEHHPELFDNLCEVTRLLDDAMEITEHALLGPLEEEEELFEEAKEIFKQGTLLLSDTFYDLDEIWERSESGGFL